MIVSCLVDSLMKLIGKKLSPEELEDTLFLLKAEIEKIEGNEIEIEINPDRQDMLSAEGIARAIRAFLGIKPGLPSFPVKKSGKKIIVEKGLERVRRYISCGIVKGVEINEDLLIQYMHLQEALTSTHGRNRNKASIGLYVHKDIAYPVRYYTEVPTKIIFSPLGHEEEMDGPRILSTHEKGIEYGPIISSFKRWPLLADADGKVLSLPPIINSNNLGRLTVETRDIFVEVTGTHLPTVNQALNIMVTSLAERGGKIESVTVEYPDGTVMETPDLKPKIMKVSREEVTQLTGIEMSDKEMLECLEKMCYSATMSAKGILSVQVPQYRTDILHSVDIIEDIAIGYGFDRIVPTMPSTMTAGKVLPITRLRNKVRELLVGMGYQEIMSYILSSPEMMNTKMLRSDALVETGNPKSRDYSIVRNALLPILLDFTAQNQHVDLPQRVFEVGDIVRPNESAETRVAQLPSVSGLTTDIKVNLTGLMNELGFLLRGLGLEGRFRFISTKDPTYIEGRSAVIEIDGDLVGHFGEINPEVLNNFQIGTPVIAFELHIPRKGEW
ncbi:MAG: phenylalanine--tRNA ligase subunit beta [Candidatus Thorarchaeota archaeon]